jgi:hypothetical protein
LKVPSGSFITATNVKIWEVLTDRFCDHEFCGTTI